MALAPCLFPNRRPVGRPVAGTPTEAQIALRPALFCTGKKSSRTETDRDVSFGQIAEPPGHREFSLPP